VIISPYTTVSRDIVPGRDMMAILAATAAVLASDNDAVFASNPFDGNVFFFLFNKIRRLS